MANERTFLAWIRTALAFLAGGIALEAFAAAAFPGPLRTGISVLLIALGPWVRPPARPCTATPGCSRNARSCPGAGPRSRSALPHYGAGVLAMVVVSLLVAGCIYATQRRRYSVASRGIAAERLRADVVAVLATSCAVLGLGVLGILVVLGQ